MEQVTRRFEQNGADVVVTFDVIEGGVSEVSLKASKGNAGESIALERKYWRDGSHCPSGNSIVFDENELWEVVNEVFTEYPDVQPINIENNG